jgi:hypothetical protein
VRAKALFIPVSPLGRGLGVRGIETGDLEPGVDYLFRKKAEHYPRPFLRISRADIRGISKIVKDGLT